MFRTKKTIFLNKSFLSLSLFVISILTSSAVWTMEAGAGPGRGLVGSNEQYKRDVYIESRLWALEALTAQLALAAEKKAAQERQTSDELRNQISTLQADNVELEQKVNELTQSLQQSDESMTEFVETLNHLVKKFDDLYEFCLKLKDHKVDRIATKRYGEGRRIVFTSPH